MAITQCLLCGKEFSGWDLSKYCSSACYHEFQRKQAAESRLVTKVCEVCGKEFSPLPGRVLTEFATKRFCSRECRGKGHRNTIDDVLKKIVINQHTGCHLFTGSRLNNGYAQVRLDNHWIMAHRAVWEHHNGPIAEGLQIDHKCRVRNCCNVDHLQVVTSRMNMLNSEGMGAVNLRKPFCPTCGGEYTVKKDGYRYCKPCFNRRNAPYLRKYRAKKRHEAGIPDGRIKLACPICGGPYSVWPNGRKYCPPCNKRRHADTGARYRAKRKQQDNDQQGKLDL